MTWVVLAFNLLMLIWLITGIGGAVQNTDCEKETTKALREACEAGTGIGTAIGAGIIVVLWALGDIILGVLWLVTGRLGRKAPSGAEAR
jgi:hypothetical protein